MVHRRRIKPSPSTPGPLTRSRVGSSHTRAGEGWRRTAGLGGARGNKGAQGNNQCQFFWVARAARQPFGGESLQRQPRGTIQYNRNRRHPAWPDQSAPATPSWLHTPPQKSTITHHLDPCQPTSTHPPMSATMWDSKEQQRYHRPPPSPRIGNGHSYQQNGHGRALSSGGGNGGSSSSSSLSNTNTSSTVAIPRRVSRLFWLLAVFTALVVLSPQFSTTSHRAVRKFRNTRVASTLRPYSRTQLSQYLSSYIPQPVWPRHMDGLPLHHHPILELIRDAQQTHSEKTARQSENVQEAEQEYRRRYEKAPPQDFDRWFTRAKGERWEV